MAGMSPFQARQLLVYTCRIQVYPGGLKVVFMTLYGGKIGGDVRGYIVLT